MYLFYQRTFVVKSENAFFDANMTVIRSPSPSYIEFSKDLENKKFIKQGEVLLYSHLIYGGIQIVKSPLSGYIHKIMIHNGDFRNVGEPIIAVLEKNYKIFIVANVLHKKIEKIHIGDIAIVELPNKDKFYARVVRVEFPYNIVEQHSRPLENIYNQARNYDRVILYPINYKVPENLIGTSAVVTIDALLNKVKWYSIKEENNEENVESGNTNNQSSNEINNEENNKTVSNNEIEINNSNKNQKIVNNELNNTLSTNKIKNISNDTNLDKNIPTIENKKTKKPVYVKRYCIIAASSNKPFNDKKSKEFLSKFNNVKIEKIGDIYELKIESFKSVKDAKQFISSKVKKYYKDAFIIKCKVKIND